MISICKDWSVAGILAFWNDWSTLNSLADQSQDVDYIHQLGGAWRRDETICPMISLSRFSPENRHTRHSGEMTVVGTTAVVLRRSIAACLSETRGHGSSRTTGRNQPKLFGLGNCQEKETTARLPLGRQLQRWPPTNSSRGSWRQSLRLGGTIVWGSSGRIVGCHLPVSAAPGMSRRKQISNRRVV